MNKSQGINPSWAHESEASGNPVSQVGFKVNHLGSWWTG